MILNRRGLKKSGVEVGVWKGEFSDFILKKWKGQKLFSVDPWKLFSSEEYIDDMNITQSSFDDIHSSVVSLLNKFGTRSQIVRKLS